MKESLTRRVGRIVSGSLNALLDAVENAAPETVMEQAIREIDGVIEDVRAELGRALANKHMAKTRLDEENRRHGDMREKIGLAVSEGRDDLAEAAIARQLDIEAQIPVLAATIDDCSTREKELEGFIAAMLAKKREMKDELRSFRDSRKQESGGIPAGLDSNGPGGARDSVEKRLARAESAFDRVLEKVTGLPGAAGIPDRKAAARMAELEDLARRKCIQDRLAQIKGQIEKK